MDEKMLLEKQAAVYLIYALSNLTGHSYKFISHSDKPDIVLKNTITRRYIGVEITHLFYDDEEARTLLGRSDGKDILFRPMSIRHYINRLNQLLDKKAKKSNNYKYYHELALAIRVASPVFDRNDFERFEKYINIPESKFDYIWLLFYNFDNYKWGFVKTLKSPINTTSNS